MATRNVVRMRLAAAGLGLALAAGGCALTEPKAERYVAPPMGTSWVRAQHDTGSYGSGSTRTDGRIGARTWQGSKVNTYELAGGTLFANLDGSWIGLFKGEAPIFTWDPPANFEWPLEIGKTWTKEQRMTIHAAKRTIVYVVTQKVESYEDVTVPAGKFKAFKVSSVTSLGDEDVSWLSPDLGLFVKQSLRRTAKHPQGPGTRVIELISYKRGS